MEYCECIDEWSTDNSMVKLQHFLDALTAIVHFSIPLMLIYFIRLYGIFPHKLVIIYFGMFSIICGAKYVTNIWRYSHFSETTSSVITAMQVCAVATSWLTVVVLFFVVPKILTLRENEHLLKNRVEELNGQKSFMLREVATRRSIKSLIDGIRSTLDGNCVVKSTVVGLGQIFDLDDCSFWFPSHTNKTLHLSHSISHLIAVGSAVPLSLPIVAEIFNTIGAVRIPHTCPMVRVKKSKCTKRDIYFEAVAIRVPLSFTEPDYFFDACAMSYAVMVLVLPSDNIRKFREYELECLGAVAKQVSVALGHASAIEESILACEHLRMQNSLKEVVIKNKETAFRNLVDSKTGNFLQMEIPMGALITLSSILLETTLTPQQRAMIEMVLRSVGSVQTLLQNERELSELEDGVIAFNLGPFNLFDAIKQVINMVNPAAAVKRLSITLALAPDLPVRAVGNLERIMQVILIVLGNAVKFTEKGYISVKASVAKPKHCGGWRPSKFHLVSSDTHFYLRIQVEDSGCGIDLQDIPNLFHPPSTSNRHSSASLGLAICKRLVRAMDGEIWVESDGLGKGCTSTFIIKLGVV